MKIGNYLHTVLSAYADDPNKPAIDFDPDLYEKILPYKSISLEVISYEEFISLLDRISNELGLPLMEYQTPIAGILNAYRIQESLEPI
jgi:hypothetical protein